MRSAEMLLGQMMARDKKRKTHSLETRLLFRFPVMGNLMNQYVSDFYKKKFGLSVPTWHTLSIIGQFGMVTPKVISDISSMNAFKISRYISKLEKDGLVVRQFDEGDKRRNKLKLTAEGQDVYDQIEAVVQSAEDSFANTLVRSERIALEHILNKLEARARELLLSRDASEAGSDTNNLDQKSLKSARGR